MALRPKLKSATVLLAAALGACSAGGEDPAAELARSQGVNDVAGSTQEKIVKPDKEWKEALTPEQYRVLRKAGTERAFSGQYWDTKTPGIYACAGCGQPLFDSQAKFDSGTGWPSFWKPVEPDKVATRQDRSLFGVQTEVLCSRCEGHLGHVFNDGPAPTGLRYCMNSAALKLVPAEKNAEQ